MDQSLIKLAWRVPSLQTEETKAEQKQGRASPDLTSPTSTENIWAPTAMLHTVVYAAIDQRHCLPYLKLALLDHPLLRAPAVGASRG